jgi:hydroxymethylpyrimidine/phosphomethylpyrimidine kinase / thiaminase
MMTIISGLERIEHLAIHDPPSPKKLEHWKEIWGRCTLLEKRFWDMAMDLS